jgi:hypothetical protein
VNIENNQSYVDSSLWFVGKHGLFRLTTISKVWMCIADNNGQDTGNYLKGKEVGKSRGQKSEDRSQKSEVRGQRAPARHREPARSGEAGGEDRGPKAQTSKYEGLSIKYPVSSIQYPVSSFKNRAVKPGTNQIQGGTNHGNGN